MDSTSNASSNASNLLIFSYNPLSGIIIGIALALLICKSK